MSDRVSLYGKLALLSYTIVRVVWVETSPCCLEQFDDLIYNLDRRSSPPLTFFDLLGVSASRDNEVVDFNHGAILSCSIEGV